MTKRSRQGRRGQNAHTTHTSWYSSFLPVICITRVSDSGIELQKLSTCRCVYRVLKVQGATNLKKYPSGANMRVKTLALCETCACIHTYANTLTDFEFTLKHTYDVLTQLHIYVQFIKNRSYLAVCMHD